MGLEILGVLHELPRNAMVRKGFLIRGDFTQSIFLQYKKKVSSFESAAFFEFGGLWEASWWGLSAWARNPKLKQLFGCWKPSTFWWSGGSSWGVANKIARAPPKPQWKGHVYFLGGVLYVSSLSQRRHGSTNGRISFITWGPHFWNSRPPWKEVPLALDQFS